MESQATQSTGRIVSIVERQRWLRARERLAVEAARDEGLLTGFWVGLGVATLGCALLAGLAWLIGRGA